MTTTFRMAALAATILLAFATKPSAQEVDPNKWYLGADLSVGTFNDMDVSGAADGEIGLKNAVMLSSLKVGYRPTSLYNDKSAVRFEFELGGRGSEIDKQTGSAFTRDDNLYGVGVMMANAYYDINPNAVWSPYIGAGVGFAGGAFDKLPGYGITDTESDDAVFAGQVMAGVSYQPASWEHTRLSLGYRYFKSDDLTYKAAGNRKVKVDGLSSHEAVLGIAYHF